jgi:outer membrane protein W
MKKILAITAGLIFVATSAFAGSTNVGISITNTTLAASGTETTNSGSTVTQAEKDGSATLASLFVEKEFEIKDKFNVSLGLDFVPMSGEIAKLGGGTGTDVKVEAGKLLTVYVQPTYLVNDKVSLYAKAGYSQGDLDITEISRQATAAQGAYGATDSASTDSDQSKDLEGTVLGFGAQINMNNDLFVRFDASRTDFDTISHTNSNSKRLTADAEMDRISIVIGKSF